MKILITGGNGFIGSAVIRTILDQGEHDVINLDDLTYASSLDSLKSYDKNKKYYFEKVNICSEISIKNIFIKHQPDRIMHFAAETHVDRSIDSSRNFINTNILGTYNLLEQSRLYFSSLKNEKKKIFFFITSQQMKFLVILQQMMSLLQKIPPIGHLLHMQPVKQVQIILLGLGIVLITCQLSFLTVLIIMVRINSQKNLFPIQF